MAESDLEDEKMSDYHIKRHILQTTSVQDSHNHKARRACEPFSLASGVLLPEKKKWSEKQRKQGGEKKVSPRRYWL